jgi:hypothetical protein
LVRELGVAKSEGTDRRAQTQADADRSKETSSAEAGQRERQRESRHWTLGPNGGLSRMGRDMRWTRGCGGCVRKQHVSLGVQAASAWVQAVQAVQTCRQCGVGGGTLVGR